MDKRVDPWGDFLRRLLLSASLAGTALPAAAAEEPEAPSAEIAGAEPAAPPHPPQPAAALSLRQGAEPPG
jgi:hypothetical protein